MQNPFPTYDICGVAITDFSYDEAVKYCIDSIRKGDKLQVVTAAAETIVRATEKPDFMEVLKQHSLNTADGMGIVWGGEKLYRKTIQHITGVELSYRLLQACEKQGYSVFLFGAKEETLVKAVDNLRTRLPGLKIAGFRNGYYGTSEEIGIVEQIKSSRANVLLVAMGMPRQDLWIHRHLKDLPCNVAIGVGGTLDVWSGNVKRAPAWISEIKMEWVYRILTDLSKLKRGKAQFQFMKMIKQQQNK